MFLTLIDIIMDETDQPEHEDEGSEKHRIESFEKLRTKLDLPSGVTFFPRPGYSFLVFLYFLVRVLSECLEEGLHHDVREGFEETEDQPTVDHLDVGGGGQVGAHTDNKHSWRNNDYYKILFLNLK